MGLLPVNGPRLLRIGSNPAGGEERSASYMGNTRRLAQTSNEASTGSVFSWIPVCQLKCGVEYDSIQWGYKAKEIHDGYDYLISSAFMSTIDTDNLSEELEKSVITPRGAGADRERKPRGS